MPIRFLAPKHYLVRTRLTREAVRERLAAKTRQHRVDRWSSPRKQGYYFSGEVNFNDFTITRAPGERNDGAVYISGRITGRMDHAEVEVTIGISRFARIFVYLFLGFFSLIFVLMLFFLALDVLLSKWYFPDTDRLLIPGVLVLFAYLIFRYGFNSIRKQTLELLKEVWSTQDITEVRSRQ